MSKIVFSDPPVIALLTSIAKAVRKLSELDTELGKGFLEIVEAHYKSKLADLSPSDRQRATVWMQSLQRFVEDGWAE